MSPPTAPWIVSVKEPVGVLFAVVTFRVDAPEPITLVGVKLAEAPEGSPATLNWTVPVNPNSEPTVTL